MLVLMLSAFPCADGLCHLAGVGGLRTRVSHLPSVCRHHAGPPPPPPPRGLSLVMSGDDDPGQDPHFELRYAAGYKAGIATQGQPVAGQTWAKVLAGPLILGLSFILGCVLGSFVLYAGVLFVGRGERLPWPLSIWVAKEKPPLTVSFGWEVVWACVATGIASCVSQARLRMLGVSSRSKCRPHAPSASCTAPSPWLSSAL